jgi:hypothetical protein
MKRFFSGIIVLPLLLMISSCTYTFYPATSGHPQPGSVVKVTTLSGVLHETSGLEIVDGSFVSFNDSGGEPALYTFDRNGDTPDTVLVEGAENVDWEDIAFDGSTIYIADIGNNFGRRDTLAIYMVSAEAIDGKAPANISGIITFSFDELVSTTLAGMYSHDCEAMFFYEDSLYLFSKDWVTRNTSVYKLPAEEGHYRLKSCNRYAVDALITGADIDPVRREVVLVGYKNRAPLLIRYGYTDDPAIIESGGKVRRYPRLKGTQMEGVCYDRSGNIFITSEKRLYKQALYRAY